MPLTRCPGCSQELDVESQWLGERVRCDVCDTEFTARAEAPVAKRPRLDDFDDERPRRRRPAYDNYDDEPPRRRRPKKKSSAGNSPYTRRGGARHPAGLCGRGRLHHQSSNRRSRIHRR